MNPGPGVLFDVDGTLVDSNYLHTLAWSRALRDCGEWAAMNVIHRLVGMGGDQLTEQLLGQPSEAAADRWRHHYEQLVDEVVVFPGAAELVAALHSAGLRVVLASSSPADQVEKMIDRLGVADVIDGATSADDADASKPAPDIFNAALAAGNVDRAGPSWSATRSGTSKRLAPQDWPRSPSSQVGSAVTSSPKKARRSCTATSTISSTSGRPARSASSAPESTPTAISETVLPASANCRSVHAGARRF